MHIETLSDTLRVSEVTELCSEDADLFLNQISIALPPRPASVEVDLSETEAIDISGLAALIEVYREAESRRPGVTLRLIDPTPPVRHLIELTRLNHVFAIVQRVHS